MKKLIRKVAIGLGVLFLVAQFFRPDRTNPHFDPAADIRSDPNVPANIRSMLDRACFNCHSNDTRWPWYSNITPVNFVVVHDVRKGRSRLNFSEWRNLKPMKKVSLLDEVYDQVSHKDMPLKEYLMMHPAARLSEADVKAICDWTGQEQDRINASLEDSKSHQVPRGN